MAKPTKPIDKIVYSEQEIQNQSFDTEFGISATQVLGYDGQNLQRLFADGLQTLLDYSGGTNPIYIGRSAPGTASSSPLWLIIKLTWDGNNNPTAIQYAAGTPNFDQVYDNRASLVYS